MLFSSQAMAGIAYEVSHPDHNVHLGNKEEFYNYFDEFLNRV